MRVNRWATFIFVLGVGLFAECVGMTVWSATIPVSMVGSNAIENDLPYGALIGQKFTATPKARFVKIHVYPDEPIQGGLREIELVSCGKPFIAVAAYINYDDAFRTGAGDMENFSAVGQTDKKLIIPANWGGPVYSVTFNFMNQSEICVQSIRFIATDGQPISLSVPRVVDAQASATSTLSPASAYDISRLFDSRYEYAWASNKLATGASLNFVFPKETKVTQIKLWNGYQRSKVHCLQNSRVKAFEVKGDGGYQTTVSVEDKMGSQIVTLPKPFNGQHLTLTVKEAYRGAVYPDLVISEMRFFDGTSWFLVNPVKAMQAVNQAHRKSFAAAGLEEILNNEIRDSDWMLRLRADGSVYLQGMSDDLRTGELQRHYVLGGYEIVGVSSSEVRLRVFGFLQKFFEGEYEGDCNGCGFKCNGPNPAENSPSESKIFQEFITIRRPNDKKEIVVVNASKKPKLSFKEITLKVSEY